MKNKRKKWRTPSIKQINIKKDTGEVIIHKKEVSPNWS